METLGQNRVGRAVMGDRVPFFSVTSLAGERHPVGNVFEFSFEMLGNEALRRCRNERVAELTTKGVVRFFRVICFKGGVGFD
jgi:hypothetical protein